MAASGSEIFFFAPLMVLKKTGAEERARHARRRVITNPSLSRLRADAAVCEHRRLLLGSDEHGRSEHGAIYTPRPVPGRAKLRGGRSGAGAQDVGRKTGGSNKQTRFRDFPGERKQRNKIMKGDPGPR